jgi:hypothetical protein
VYQQVSLARTSDTAGPRRLERLILGAVATAVDGDDTCIEPGCEFDMRRVVGQCRRSEAENPDVGEAKAVLKGVHDANCDDRAPHR